MPAPKAIGEWKPETVTPRDVIAHPDVSITVHCEGCRMIVGFNVFKLGMRLADTPLQRLRLRCQRCGVYASAMTLDRARVGQIEAVFKIDLKPVWDDGHAEAQARALKRQRAWRPPGI
ncbi:MAG: hypothetical protein EON58_15265 [Alphaproteobacteria bacterium]|nr:MAG: hypothetical protein EON58_15265 [Alphaproteobacteria bacterium]